MEFNNLLNHLILDYQENFPLVKKPFHQIADELGVSAEEVLKGYQFLKEKNILSRLGPVFRTHSLGYSFLAAIACPEERIEEVAGIVNSYKQVNHNYQRENTLNIWFVCTGESKESLDAMIKELEERIALTVWQFPMKKAFKIDLKTKAAIDWGQINE